MERERKDRTGDGVGNRSAEKLLTTVAKVGAMAVGLGPLFTAAELASGHFVNKAGVINPPVTSEKPNSSDATNISEVTPGGTIYSSEGEQASAIPIFDEEVLAKGYPAGMVEKAKKEFPENYQKIQDVKEQLLISVAVFTGTNLALNPVIKYDGDRVEEAYYEWVLLQGSVELNGEIYNPGTVIVSSDIIGHEGEILLLSPDQASKKLGIPEIEKVGIDVETGLASAWKDGMVVGQIDNQTGQWVVPLAQTP